MLQLKDIYVSFDDNIIYNHTDFYAYDNELTIVVGKSGSGKSTLHQLIALQKENNCQYDFGDINIRELSFIQQRSYIKEKMGIVNQVPTFINDLTIRNHIELCQSLWNGYDVEEYIRLLEIQDSLDEYPQQLSGGEKIRASILLAMIHQPEILVFDEPTASLDRHHTEIIVDLLKQYAHQGHIVIVFTHDSLLKQKGDTIYQIENQLLQCVKKNAVQIDVERHLLSVKTSKHYIQYIYKMLQHKKGLKIFMICFVAFAIALSCFSLLYGYSVINKYQDELSQTNKAGIICRTQNLGFGFFNDDVPIGKDELKEIQNIDHIENIWPYIPNYGMNSNESHLFKIYQNNELLTERYQQEGYPYVVSTYNEQYQYSHSHFIKDYDVDRGIYIDEHFLYYLISGYDNNDYTQIDQEEFEKVISNINTNTEIEFPIYIPQLIQIDSNNQTIHYQKINIRMKIKGIYSHSSEIELSNQFNGSQIFYPLEIEENYRSQIDKDSLSKTYRDNDSMIILFEHIYYHFTVTENSSFLDVKEDIESLGYKVSSDYYDKEVRVDIARDLNEGIFMISILIMCVVLMLLFGVKYNQKKDFSDFIKFFTNRGLTYKKSKRLLSLYFLWEATLSAILSIVFMGIIIYVYYFIINPEAYAMRISFFGYCIILALIIEVGIPLLIVRGVKND